MLYDVTRSREKATDTYLSGFIHNKSNINTKNAYIKFKRELLLFQNTYLIYYILYQIIFNTFTYNFL